MGVFQRSCASGKVCFPSEGIALLAAASPGLSGDPQEPYDCPQCPYWHLRNIEKAAARQRMRTTARTRARKERRRRAKARARKEEQDEQARQGLPGDRGEDLR